MAKLIFNYESSQGFYTFVAEIKDKTKVEFEIKTFENRFEDGGDEVITSNGVLNSEQDKLDAFFKNLESVYSINPDGWSSDYFSDEEKEFLEDLDSSYFELSYVNTKNLIYHSRGEMSCAPWQLVFVMRAIAQCDPWVYELLQEHFNLDN